MMLVAPVGAASARESPMDRHRPKWTELDVADLRLGFRNNLSVSDIAGELLRTEVDVLAKAQELGINLRID
jgi:hypothetical protein